MLDKHFVTGRQGCGKDHEVRHRSTVRGYYVLGRCATLGGQSFLQWLVTVITRPVDLQVLDLYRKLAQRITDDAAVRKIELRMRPRLGPVHVLGTHHARVAHPFLSPGISESNAPALRNRLRRWRTQEILDLPEELKDCFLMNVLSRSQLTLQLFELFCELGIA